MGDMSAAVQATLDELTLGPQDEAAAQLAELYAATLDEDPSKLASLGPQLLSILDALTATPAARAKVLRLARPSSGAGNDLAKQSPLDRLREQREKRAGRES